MGKLFGTDGIRGKANEHPMTVEMAVNLGRAVANLFRWKHKPGRIVVGKDTRLSCYIFESALAAGICSMGAECWLLGPLPTPGIAHITSSMRADAGLVISASHNPFWDNGIKVFASDGFKLPDDREAELEQLMESDELNRSLARPEEMGQAWRIEDARGRYIAFLKHSFPDELSLEGLRIVVDCANGAAYRVAPAVFSELGARVIPLGVDPNGRNINDGCGALHPEQVQREVVEHGAQLGISLDGDADRVILVDEKGQVVNGDAIMAMVATRMLREGTLKKETLVVTSMSNLGLEHAVDAAGGRLVRTDVGDRYVVEEMRRGGYNMGGEQSGHLIFLDHMTTGDGVVGALQVLAVMLREGRPLSELAGVMEQVPQVLVNLWVTRKPPIQEMPAVARLIAEVEQKLGKDGRVLVRYSGTEPKARVMIEGPEEGLIRGLAEQIAGAIRDEVGAPAE
jgi:phosphoglucosamine mutase